MAHDILIVDDESDIRDLIAGILNDEGYGTRTAGNAETALAEVARRRPSLLVLDIWLQGSDLDGMQILDRVVREHPNLPVIMISGHGTIENAVAAMRRGAFDFIEKPFKTDRLLLQVARALDAARLRREVDHLRAKAGIENELIGGSAVMATLRQAIERIAPTNSRVLIFGPPGSGKEVVARLLHSQSRRAEGPFVVLNAASMAPDRLEVELFGTEDGHDVASRIGTFEQAHGGTLFIDEVADMPLETQAKILRVLVDQTFERVGGRHKVQVDVRVISATSRDLAAEIADGNFRQDLFHRLNVVPLKVPPLRERREDIPELALHLMRRESEVQGLAPREIADDVLIALQSADWPGNVRELRNLIARLLILAPGDARAPIHVEMLPTDFGSSAPAMPRPEGSGEIMALPLRDAREIFEREYLLAQINRFGGNISKTAAFVGMERSALHRKLKSLGVSSNERAN